MTEPLTRPWQKDRNEYLEGFTREQADNYLQPGLEFQKKLVKAFVDAGVPVLAGTDAGIPIVVPGFSLHLELVELVEAGMTPYQALAAATTGAAKLLGIQDTTGTIAPGVRADLILLKANPLEDIRNTQRRAGVVVNGRWMDEKTVNEMLEELRVAAAN